MNIRKIEKMLFGEHPDFVRFLKEKNAFKAFFITFKRYLNEIAQLGNYAIDYYIKNRVNTPKQNLIINAFNWGQSHEGSMYWLALSMEWADLIKKKKQHGTLRNKKTNNRKRTKTRSVQ